MLKVYVSDWCPYCERAERWLKENRVPFTAINIEYEPPLVMERVIEANGGKTWNVPTFEYRGQWLVMNGFNHFLLEKWLCQHGLITHQAAAEKHGML